MSQSPAYPPLQASGPLPGVPHVLKRVYMIRHGETDANASGLMQGSGVDLPLSLKGRAQAKALGDHFKDTPVDVIVVSALKRTLETAMYIKQYHPNAEVVSIEALNEISWGQYEGKLPTPGLKDLWREWEKGNFDASAPEGESPLQTELRSVPALYNLMRNSSDQKVHYAIVIHGRLIRIILASILNHDLSYMNTYTHTNTCVNVLDAAILGPGVSKESADAFREQFLAAIKPRVASAAVSLAGGVDAVGAVLAAVTTQKEASGATTPVNVARPLPKEGPTVVSHPDVGHPNDIIFRAVALNDTAHLANL
ncbi:histidine phosphatase superfamily [Chytriomyces sp. MP71]|nr:histidine phosphatase superfamily [Chytriomyces sp. MP71]